MQSISRVGTVLLVAQDPSCIIIADPDVTLARAPGMGNMMIGGNAKGLPFQDSVIQYKAGITSIWYLAL